MITNVHMEVITYIILCLPISFQFLGQIISRLVQDGSTVTMVMAAMTPP